MSQHPIIMDGESVRAILAGRKTVTRRLSERWLRVKRGDLLPVKETWLSYRESSPERTAVAQALWKGVQSGRLPLSGAALSIPAADGPVRVAHRADFDEELAAEVGPWKSPLFMPLKHSRILLEATEDARREYLWDITEAEALAEGCDGDGDDPFWRPSYHDPDSGGSPSARRSFEFRWDSLHAKDAPWASNPAVIRVAFRVVERTR
jgi:hypothetical protein